MADRDDELVRAAAGGNHAAFRTLVERHERRIYSVCLRLVGNPDDAADATQDAFLTAYRKLSSFRGEASFSTWLHRVAMNASYDLLRKRQRAPMLSLVGDRDEPEPGSPAPDHSDETVGSIDAARALAGVPEDFRAALVLHDVHDLPVREVAEILGVAVGTVKSRLHRGRIMLATAMIGGSPGEPDAGETDEPGAGEPGERGGASNRGTP